MSLRVNADCIGCGACEYACLPGALRKTDAFLGVFAIDPFLCDDCGQCVAKCPVDAIVSDSAWPQCQGRGCPLSARRMAGFECAVWEQTCPQCGATMWMEPGGSGAWVCSRCDLHMRVVCPKVHHLPGHASAERAVAPSTV